jgi:hypothetical protein
MTRALLLVLAAASAACSDPLCGTGTVKDGRLCVLTVDAGQECCGPGTHMDETSTCIPDEPPRVCGELCTWEHTVDGVTYCDVPPPSCGSMPCPPPGPGHVTVCGSVLDAETGTTFVPVTGLPCSAENPGGACVLNLRFRDRLDLGAGVIAPTQLRFTDCGRFAVELPEPASGVLAIILDDDGSKYVPSMFVQYAPEGTLRNDLTLHAVRRDTDALWVATAGDPFDGVSFSERGAHLLLLQYGYDPVAGVTVGNGTTFYFGDAEADIRSTVDPETSSTGANGAALRVDSSVGATASGGEATGCHWDPLPLGIVPGYVWVEPSLLVTDMFEETCP